MTDILDKDRSNLLTELAGAAFPERAVRVLENETDKLLLKHNESCTSDVERESAAYLMQAVRLSLPLIDSAGKTKVWEHETGPGSNAKISIPGVILGILGIGLAAFGLIPMAMVLIPDADTALRNDLLVRCAAIGVGVIAVYVSGFLVRRPAKGGPKEQHVEIRVDPEKLYRSYRNAILAVDQSLDEIRAKERWDKREQAGNIDGRQATTPELELFSDLLAASYSGDPEYALEKIDAIKYYLHRQQIEVIDYSDKTRQYFDTMPGTRNATIRPAMTANGELLMKGLASVRK